MANRGYSVVQPQALQSATEDQARGESPEHHEKRARYYAEAKGWKVEEVYDPKKECRIKRELSSRVPLDRFQIAIENRPESGRHECFQKVDAGAKLR